MRLVLLSGRPGGNSETLARRAFEGREPRFLRLDLPPFQDLRPQPPAPEGALAQVVTALTEAQDITLAAPVYWYALPASAKLLFDHWSNWLDVPDLAFFEAMRGKTFRLITARADPDPTVPAPMETSLRRSVDWLQMHWGGALHGVGDAPGDILADGPALHAAARFLP